MSFGDNDDVIDSCKVVDAKPGLYIITNIILY